jgi:hypothetical protein
LNAALAAVLVGIAGQLSADDLAYLREPHE